MSRARGGFVLRGCRDRASVPGMCPCAYPGFRKRGAAVARLTVVPVGPALQAFATPHLLSWPTSASILGVRRLHQSDVSDRRLRFSQSMGIDISETAGRWPSPSSTDHRATALERQGLGYGRIPGGLEFSERVAENEHLLTSPLLATPPIHDCIHIQIVGTGNPPTVKVHVVAVRCRVRFLKLQSSG